MSLHTPLVSVIIIFYNSEKFLQESICSILNQNYKNWELILVDDGSTDSSSSIARRYSENFPGKIFYFEHQNHVNKGKSTSRNLGIKFSKGDFITFLDADDIYLSTKLEEQLKIFKKYPGVSCVFGATKIWYTWDLSNTRKDYIQTLQVPEGIYQPRKFFKLLLTQKAATPAICSLIIRRSLVDMIKGFEDNFKEMYEDQVFYYKIAFEGTCYVDSNYYALYRIHKDSSYQKSIANKTVLKYKFIYFQWLYDYVKNKKVDDRIILNTIKKEIWLSKHSVFDYIYRRILKQRRKFFPVKVN